MRFMSELSAPFLVDHASDATVTQQPTHMPLVTLLLSCAFLSHFLVSCIASFLPQHLVRDGFSPLVAGVLFAVFPAAVLLFSPLTSNYFTLNIRNSRKTVVWTLLCQGIATLIFGYTEWLCDALGLSRISVFILYATSRVFQAVGSAWASAALFSLVAERFEEVLGKLMKLSQIVNGLGFTLGPPIGAMLRSGNDVSSPFTVIACVIFLQIPLIYWDRASIQSCAQVSGVERPSAVPLMRSFRVLRSCGFLFLGTCTFGLIEPAYALHAESYLHVSSVAIGYMFALLLAVYSGCGLLIGDFGLSRSLGVSIAGGCLAAVSLAGLGLHVDAISPVDDVYAFRTGWETFMLLILGIGQAALLVPCLFAVKESVENNTCLEEVLILYNNVHQVSMIAGPLIGAFLSDFFGFQAAACAGGTVIAAYTTMIWLLSFVLPRFWRSTQQQPDGHSSNSQEANGTGSPRPRIWCGTL